MTPAQILKKLAAGIRPWVESKKGKLHIAHDGFHVLHILGNNPPGFVVILLWESDADATGQPLAGIVENRIAVVISQNRGLRVWNGESLVIDYADQPAFLDRLSDLRARIRATPIIGDGADSSQDLLYLGCEPETTPDGLPLDAYRMRFSLTATMEATE